MSIEDHEDYVRRALAAYFRSGGKDQPSSDSGVRTIKGRTYVHLFNVGGTLAVYRVPDPGRCGIVTLGKNGVVKEFVEKPPIPSSNLAFSGVLIGTEQLLPAIPNRLPADIGFDVLPRLVNQMSAYETSDFLLDIGTVQNYKEAQATWPGLGNGKV